MAKHNENNAEREEKILVDIEKFGWAVILIEGTDYLPTFAYTIGLYKNYRHPEIIAFGLDLETLHEIINSLGEMVKSGNIFEPLKNYPEIFDESRTEFIKVDPKNIEDYFGYAVDYYEENHFPAVEIIWADENNFFPWEEDYDEDFKFSQPLLDRNMTFKFSEEPDLEVFAAYGFFENGDLITRVVHDIGGEWHFYTLDSKTDDMGQIELEKVIAMDPTMNETFYLDYGEQAIR